ncbi:MAG TPA: PfkB family carbohydrate kinase, partial [Candidatus Obscuribacterales bacterium]
DLQRLETYLPTAQWLLMQFELPLPTVIAAAHLAQAAGVRVMLDPAPVQTFNPADLYPQVDILTPNQGEAAQLVGFPVETIAQAQAAIAHLQGQGAATVIITLGAQGIVCGTPDETFHHPALPVTVVDTVAAGDAFNGGLAVALAEGKPLNAAIAWATATAAYAVTQAGAQPSLPRRSQVAQLLARG